ncbi:hypothetical protein TU77_17395 [Pseudomonas synxantha]|nr:hypothetical protein TU77_17395 [Pseudomonas synxantha]
MIDNQHLIAAGTASVWTGQVPGKKNRPHVQGSTCELEYRLKFIFIVTVGAPGQFKAHAWDQREE